jgi:hypothetical protein
MKKISLLSLLVIALVAPGCSWFRHQLPSGPNSAPVAKATVQPAVTATPAPAPIVTPDLALAAKVVRVNDVARIAILNFPDGKMPRLQSTFYVYRSGIKVAEVKIVGPQDDENNIVADVISGDPQVGLSVRAD